MKSICYIVPYFGKLPKGFKMWLLSCRANNSIHWILYTDDRTPYDYPENVKVKYCSYQDIKKKIQLYYNFKVIISKPWKLCDFRPAYGEIFADDLKGYDFWGHCDMDLIWGDIRKFITDDILEKYEKIGFQGHSVIYRNTEEVNKRYRTMINGIMNYKEVFSCPDGCFFDETGICEIYDALEIDYYRKTNFAHLDRFTSSFFLLYLPEKDNYKNDRQVFIWDKGTIQRYFLDGLEISKEEYMYIHYFSRPIEFKVSNYDFSCTYVLYPDILTEIKEKDVTYSYIKRKGTCSTLRFYFKIAIAYRKKLSLKKIIFYLKKKGNLAKKRGYN